MVRLESTTRRYIGLSSDDKPVFEEEGGTRRLPAGSSFLESDTGRIFRFTGSEWRAPETSSIEDKLDGILGELTLIREFIAEHV